MWWDWSEITLFETVLFSILTISILYFVGYGFFGLFCYLSKKKDPFIGFDAIQKASYRVLFGFIFVFLIYLAFSFFNNALLSTLIVVAITIVGVSTRVKEVKFFKKSQFRNISNFVVLAILVACIVLTSMLVVGLYGSTIDDGADHTLMTRVILDHPISLLTRSALPTANFTLNYPSGSHVLCAFLASLLNVSIQKIVILVVVILPTLIAFSFYTTLKCLFENKAISLLGLVVAAFLAIGFTWGPIGWAGLPVLLSLYLSITGIGLIFSFLLKRQLSLLNAFLLGLVFFISSQTYPTALLIESIWFFLILTAKIAIELWHIHSSKLSTRSFFKLGNLSLMIAFLIPILFSIPYFYSIYAHNIAGVQLIELNPASNSLAESVRNRMNFNWIFDLPSLSTFYSELGIIFSLAPFGIIIIITFYLPRIGKKIRGIFPEGFVYNALSIYLFRVAMMAYLGITLFIPINFLTDFFNPERVWQHVFIAATIMTTIVIFSVSRFAYVGLKQLAGRRSRVGSKLSSNKVIVVILSLLLLSTAGFLSLPVIAEQQKNYTAVGYYLNYYSVLGHDDVVLMNWIKENVSSQAFILVSRGDSGQYLTAVTGKQAFCGYNGLENYSSIMTLLTANSSDLRAVPYLIGNKISYVYIGSISSSFALDSVVRRTFNATQFLETPHFNLVKEVGNAWLFEFNASSALKAVNESVL